MTTWKRITIVLVLFTAALGCYILGVTSGAISLLVLGAVLEICFWCGLLQNSKQRLRSGN